MDQPQIKIDFQDQVAEVAFYHPKANTFAMEQLRELAEIFHSLGQDGSVRVIVLSSLGDKIFSAGAYFDELLQLGDIEAGKIFFCGFAQVILNMIRCPKPVVGCVRGKVIGGAVGLVSACDHAVASTNVSVRLSELSIGIGPFVIEPIIRRRIGSAHFMSLSLDPMGWRSADWCKTVGLVAETVADSDGLKNRVWNFARQLSSYSPEAMHEMKKMFWDGTDHWDGLLKKRAAISASLILTPYAKAYLRKFKQKMKRL
ncbi:MAG: enoyl-CoA hydratase/isomerase family protein [Flavobacteriales bacterium Tduv]